MPATGHPVVHSGISIRRSNQVHDRRHRYISKTSVGYRTNGVLPVNAIPFFKDMHCIHLKLNFIKTKFFLLSLVLFSAFSNSDDPDDIITGPNQEKQASVFVTVNVTEFGPPGKFIRGDFFGKINKGSNGSGGNGPSDFSGSFALWNE